MRIRSTLLAVAALAAATLMAAPAADAAPVANALCSTTLQQGSSGSCVTALQTRLNQLGGGLAVDGAFGPGTRNAVEAFQGRSSITMDGVVGPDTRNHLNAPGSVTLDRVSTAAVQAQIRAVFGSAATTALAVARCESSYNEIAINRNSTSRDLGVFQLNDGGTLQGLGGTRAQALHYTSDISLAHTLYLQRGWQPWISSKGCWG